MQALICGYEVEGSAEEKVREWGRRYLKSLRKEAK
jgi:hypothetical protein